MNGSCAGGTGAFIDQMATLLKMSADEMNKAAEQATRTYTIASRCGVFAKSDVQPLINQGAKTEDIAASIYKAVVNQTIAGLAQGRPIQGNILYLGGPLTFSTVLRKSFDEALGVTGTCPENSLLYVALGAALYADKEFVLSDVAAALDEYAATATYASEPPLFASKEEYEAFHARHMSHSVPRVAFSAQFGPVHIGIDSGSTTVKLVVVDEQSQILYTNYQPNLGNPLPLIRQQLLKIYKEHPGLKVASVTTTGYGEELVKNAFRCDYTNGRIEDLRAAAEILKGRKVKKGLRCIVIPATQAIYLQAIEEGLVQTFIQAGAVVSTPTCGPCLGGYMGILAAHERCVSTTNRNFVGRMGDVTSEVYLASPYVAAASAVTGKISGPKDVL